MGIHHLLRRLFSGSSFQLFSLVLLGLPQDDPLMALASTSSPFVNFFTGSPRENFVS